MPDRSKIKRGVTDDASIPEVYPQNNKKNNKENNPEKIQKTRALFCSDEIRMMPNELLEDINLSYVYRYNF